MSLKHLWPLGKTSLKPLFRGTGNTLVYTDELKYHMKANQGQ